MRGGDAPKLAGEHIDLAAQAYVASFLEQAFVYYTYQGLVAHRAGARGLNPWGIYECADGLIFLCTIEEDQWERLVQFMGNPDWAGLEIFGLPAGSMAYFLSFNHDTNRFEIVATDHVLDDGSCIVTDLGAGITTAAWGCNCPPYSATCAVCKCASCDRCESEVRDTNPPTCLTLTKRR